MKRMVTLAMTLLLAASASLPALAAPLLTPQPPKTQAKSSAPVQLLVSPRQVDDDDQERWERLDEAYVASLGDFSAQSAAKLLGEQTENAMYSPASLYMALSLAAEGARGETQTEMLNLLGVSAADLSQLSRRLFVRLYRDEDGAVQKMANSLWIGQGQTPRQQYMDTAAKDFFASAYLADFSKPEAGQAMSKWVSDNTGGVLSPSFETKEDWRMVLINTLYTKMAWARPFPQEATREEPFYLADGTSVTTPFMHQEIDYSSFWKGDGYRASELPTRFGRMVVVLPNEGVSPADLLAKPENLPAMLDLGRKDRQSDTKVVFSVPKFSFGNTFGLDETLNGLGMKKAFTGAADFSGMLAGPTYFSKIQQGTHIEIDEEGFEAAAYTLMPTNTGGSPPPTTKVEHMKLDRPFLFAILSGDDVPLFIGIVADPTQN